MREILGLGLVLLLAGTAAAQTSPSEDPYLTALEATLRFQGEGVRVASQVGRGDSIISMPVTHLRTGILRNDLRLRGGALANYLDAGVPGFYAGEFAVEGQSAGPMWCFARRAENLGAGTRCILEYGAGSERVWVGAGDPTNMYFPVAAEVHSNPSTLPTPEIDEQPVSVNPSLTADYVFRGWGRDYADVQLQLGGRPLLAVGVFKRIPREADNSALLATPFGLIRLEQVASNRGAATVSFAGAN